MINKFAEKLKELRIENGLSQAQLADNLGNKITHSAIGLWELGKRIPNVESVIIIAKYFNVTVDYILGLED